MTAVPLLYDPDCGFCRVSLAVFLRWDTRGRLRPVALGTEEADSLLAGMPEERRMASWHLALPGRPVRSAGAAFPELFRMLPGGRPFAALTARFPRASDAGVSPRGRSSLAARPRPALGRASVG